MPSIHQVSQLSWKILRSLTISPVLCLILGGILLVAPNSGSQAARILVRSDGTGDVPTIQAAISQAAGRDTIDLANGLFMGPGNRDLSLLGKEITIRSLSGLREACVIDCAGAPSDEHRALRIDAGDGPFWMENLTIRGGYRAQTHWEAGSGGAVLMTGGATEATIRGCLFVDNVANSGAGIHVHEGSKATIEDCLFQRNRAVLVAGAIDAGGGDVTVVRCLITGNQAGAAGALRCDVGGSLRVISSTITGNRVEFWGGGLALMNCSATLERTILWGNCSESGALGHGVYLFPDASATLTGCAVNWPDFRGSLDNITWDGEQVWEDPEFCGPLDCLDAPSIEGDYRLAPGSPCLAESCVCEARVGAPTGECGTASLPVHGEEGPPSLSWSVYPNPTQGSIGVDLDLVGARQPVTIDLLDASGRRVVKLLQRSVGPGPHSFRWRVEELGLPGGVYFTRVGGAEGSEGRRLVVLH